MGPGLLLLELLLLRVFSIPANSGERAEGHRAGVPAAQVPPTPRESSGYTSCHSLEPSLATPGHLPSFLIQVTCSRLWGRPVSVSVAGCDGGQARGKAPSPQAWPSVPAAGLASTLLGAGPSEPLSGYYSRACSGQRGWAEWPPMGRVPCMAGHCEVPPGRGGGHCSSPGPGTSHPIIVGGTKWGAACSVSSLTPDLPRCQSAPCGQHGPSAVTAGLASCQTQL